MIITLAPSDNPEKNFGLTRNKFEGLLKALQQGDEELIEVIYLKHFGKCLNYLIRYCGADYESAYSATMNALLEIRKDLVKDKIEYDNLENYFTRRAKMKLSKIKKPPSITEQPNINIPDHLDLSLVLDRKDIAEKIGQALSQLGGKCAILIKLRFYDELTWPKIAKRLHPNVPETEIERIRNTLSNKNKRQCLPAFKRILKTLL